ncbi:MAG: IclR family transcriptional regulator [Phyllobacteriaceae bacterium]|nr:IclR family transcriptional regulator [Phyllobacteriaceae bacterium]
MIELDKSSNQSTQIAFAVIECMVEFGRPVALAELTRRLDIPKVRVFRFLRTLLAMGYVLQDADTEHYRLSYKLYHLGQALADSTDMLREARPVMTELRDKTGMTVSFGQIEESGMRVLDMVRSEHPVAIVTRPGALLDFHSSAQGKVALAFGDKKLWQQVPEELRPWTSATNTDRAKLEAEVAKVLKQGWADAPGETLEGVSALSAPVRDMTGNLIATLTLAGPTNFLGSPPKDQYIAAICESAARISSNLGYTGTSA